MVVGSLTKYINPLGCVQNLVWCSYHKFEGVVQSPLKICVVMVFEL